MDRAFFFAILTSLIWGFAPAFEKLGLTGRIDPFLGVVIRTIPIAVISLAGLVLMGRAGSLSTVDLRSALFIIAGGIIAGRLGQFAFYSALKTGQASVVVPIAATYPLVAFVVSMVFLGESFTWHKAIGICLVVGGVIMLR
mgnify:CR=1 FL=1